MAADTKIQIESGFWNSVSGDRLYDADDMNKPYKRLISEGIFPDAGSEPSADFEVVFVSGLDILVKAGDALLGGRWIISEQDQAITIQQNSSANPRIDSIIIQVDTTLAGRDCSIIYRQGTPAASPTAPAINTEEGVLEWRIANIWLAAGAGSITADDITDLRGEETPWAKVLMASNTAVELPVTKYATGTTGVSVHAASAFRSGNTVTVWANLIFSANKTLSGWTKGITIDEPTAYPMAGMADLIIDAVGFDGNNAPANGLAVRVRANGEIQFTNGGAGATPCEYNVYFSYFCG